MAIPLETWYYDIPVITRTYITAALSTSLAVQLRLVHPLQLYLNYDLIVYKRQYWRLLTNFLFFGKFSLDLLFHMFFLARYSRMLEEGSFRNRSADYFWMLVLSSISLVILCVFVPFTDMPFLGSPLAFTLVYVWSRRNPYIRLNFLGLFVFSAPWLPWVLLAFSLLIGSNFPTGDLMGIAVGHLYYFLEDIWPREPQSGGRRWLKTPELIVRLIDGPEMMLEREVEEEEEYARDDQQHEETVPETHQSGIEATSTEVHREDHGQENLEARPAANAFA
ncbi:hypothetical protein BZG36_01209 [Bifiguratus adelaidae]|uniref:Derlin n=1 Tax=Bifiguratus adelaidae TaxID=1938954 RepID=A0A261Y5L6_9FUNG|nr:hypothetical protein BZG36_01209 [Bifiguratus adelaidae]